MAIDQKELGQRLKRAREAMHLTQDDVARHLEISRSTVAQMELGNRAVSGLELSRLATLFGRDLRSFVADEPSGEEDVLVALFRLHPELSHQRDVLEALRQCMALGRELTQLERRLGIDRDVSVAAYPQPRPQSKWEAIVQGERVALEERRRLGLGMAPLPDIAELLEAQGVRTARIDLPEDISGLTLIEPQIGLFLVTNRRHHLLRRRFSCAHEYAHLLMDRDQRGVVSRAADRNELIEVRANAFAASLLMPDASVHPFIGALGKGRPSRMEASAFDEQEAVSGRARAAPGSQDIQLYDVVQMAHHFGVSRATALYRLKNLRLLTQPQLEYLLEQERACRGRELQQFLGLPEPDHQAHRNEFRHRFLGLALEAFRRDEISQSKLVQVAAMVGAGRSDVLRAVEDLGLDDDGADVRVPET